MNKAQKILRIAIWIAVFGILGTIVYVGTRQFALGPEIEIYSPTAGESTTTPLINVSGHAVRISFIYLNDAPIYTDEKGDFQAKLLAYPGYNIIKLRAEDRFKRTVEDRVDFIYKETKTTKIKPIISEVATTSPETKLSE